MTDRRYEATPAILAAGWAAINKGRTRSVDMAPGPALREAWPEMLKASGLVDRLEALERENADLRADRQVMLDFVASWRLCFDDPFDTEAMANEIGPIMLRAARLVSAGRTDADG